jgi:hypothetical protein
MRAVVLLTTMELDFFAIPYELQLWEQIQFTSKRIATGSASPVCRVTMTIRAGQLLQVLADVPTVPVPVQTTCTRQYKN